MKKYVYCLVLSIILLALMLLSFAKTDKASNNTCPLEFILEQETHDTKILTYESEDGAYYVFLPSYAKMDVLRIRISADTEVSLGGTAVTNGMSCEGFKLETAYALFVDNQYIAELLFYRSDNVATLYINTETGSMNRVHKEKTYSEQASVELYTSEGILNVIDSAASIKGRGNATWKFDKRPYLLTLSSDMDLLGMGTARKWVLLANAADATNLNNKLILDMARQTGQGWSPENAFVDVYLNGEYGGLYLLTEKVEAGVSRLDIDPQAGDFLCKVDLNTRWTSLNNPVITQSGRIIEITSPGAVSDFTKTNILNEINRMEQIIMSGSDLSEMECFDLDSWVQKYLLDEIAANIDADLVSSYFYYLDGVFYAGPLWDYDMAFGHNARNKSPTAFMAKNQFKSDSYVSIYYPALYANESFYNRMLKRYQFEFLPLLNQMIEVKIPELAMEIHAATTMNNIRWQTMFSNKDSWNEDVVDTVDSLISYLKNRIEFLNSAWLEGEEYCTVQFEHTNREPYWTISVLKGNPIATDTFDLENAVWIDEATGNIVDFNQPVMSDMLLVEKSALNTIDFYSLKSCVDVFCVSLFVLVLCELIYVDIQQRRKEGRAANETKRSYVSPRNEVCDQCSADSSSEKSDC